MDSDLKPAGRSAKSSKAGAFKAKTQTSEETEVFRTPDEVAAGQSFDARSETSPQIIDEPGGPDKPKSSWKERLALHWPPGKKEYITAAVILLLVGGGIFFALTHNSKPAASKQTKKAATITKPKTVPSTLSGLPVDPSVNGRPVTGVMIENSLDARPQAGLGQASVVFEAIAEGGITRFLALFQDTAPENIGPVRSARPYYIEWNLGFNAGYAHVGGSPEALADIKAWGVRDLDQFANSGSYRRVADRAAPHNVYTSMAALNQLEASKGWTSSTFTGFVRKPKETPSKTPTAKTIDLKLSGPLYNVHYDYAPASNTYARGEGGAQHIDANTNSQINVKVVVAMVVPYGIAPDGHHSEYATIGSGPVSIFQDGIVTTGTWTKTAGPSQITFADATGKPIKLNPGQTWLTTVGDAGSITYAP